VQQAGRIDSVPISEVAGKVRTIPLDSEVLRAARTIGTSFGE
jgi:6-phosphofructokinase 1